MRANREAYNTLLKDESYICNSCDSESVVVCVQYFRSCYRNLGMGCYVQLIRVIYEKIVVSSHMQDPKT